MEGKRLLADRVVTADETVAGALSAEFLWKLNAGSGRQSRLYVFQPSNSRSTAELWTVEAFQERTADEKLHELVQSKDWPAALQVAERHGLQTDPILK